MSCGLGQQLQDRMLLNSDELIQYYAIDMEDMDNFDFHLRKILIPRVPDTKGSKTVREVCGWISGKLLLYLICLSNDLFYKSTFIFIAHRKLHAKPWMGCSNR